MPIYRWKCERCGDERETLQKHSDPPPVCGPCDDTLPQETPYMSKLVSRSSFILKGTGWEKDGYQG